MLFWINSPALSFLSTPGRSRESRQQGLCLLRAEWCVTYYGQIDLWNQSQYTVCVLSLLFHTSARGDVVWSHSVVISVEVDSFCSAVVLGKQTCCGFHRNIFKWGKIDNGGWKWKCRKSLSIKTKTRICATRNLVIADKNGKDGNVRDLIHWGKNKQPLFFQRYSSLSRAEVCGSKFTHTLPTHQWWDDTSIEHAELHTPPPPPYCVCCRFNR